MEVFEPNYWTKTCASCESSVSYHCKTCGDYLCTRCKEIHIKSNSGKDHDVSLYHTDHKSSTRDKCAIHAENTCECWCNHCNEAVCTDCMTSTTHECHHFVKLRTKLMEKRKEMAREQEDISDAVLKLTNHLDNTPNLRKSFEDELEQLDVEIARKAEEICEKVRKIEARKRREAQEMKNTYIANVFSNYESTIKDKIEEMKEKKKTINDKLDSANETCILQHKTPEPESYGNKSLENSSPHLRFKQGNIDPDVLETMFGTIEYVGGKAVSEYLNYSEAQAPKQTVRKYVCLSSNSVSTIIMTNLHNDASPMIACTNRGHAWIRTSYQTIELYRKDGLALETINLQSTPSSFDQHGLGQLVISLPHEQSVNILTKKNKIELLFRTKYSPSKICCLYNENIAVAFRSRHKVIQYNMKGEIQREVDSDRLMYPWFLCQNKITRDICITDKHSGECHNSLGRVVILNKDFHFRYEYTGFGENACFTPMGLSSDSVGNILVTDLINSLIHILDKDGTFLQYFDTGKPRLLNPWTIDVDSHGYAWIAEKISKKVKVTKYLEYRTNEEDQH